MSIETTETIETMETVELLNETLCIEAEAVFSATEKAIADVIAILKGAK